MLDRQLEPEVMDSPDEARDYDAMDHREVNSLFVCDLVDAGAIEGELLDLGTGTAQIPIELCQRHSGVHVLAVDLAENMLAVARENVEAAGLSERIRLERVDAKRLSYDDGRFDAIISNSIVHHIAEPRSVLAEAVRVVKPGGLLMFRDLLRPADGTSLQQLVDAYAGDANGQQRKMFRDSLHAALTIEEIGALVEQLGFPAGDVQPTSDRHWTWRATRP